MIYKAAFDLLLFRSKCVDFVVEDLEVNTVYEYVRKEFINFSCQNLSRQIMYA